jgi:hypothetical protein
MPYIATNKNSAVNTSSKWSKMLPNFTPINSLKTLKRDELNNSPSIMSNKLKQTISNYTSPK